MQVTSLSGHHNQHGAYTNTWGGIEANIQDGIDLLNDYRRAIRNETKDQRYGDYKDVFDKMADAEIIRTTLHYDGGNNPIQTYTDGQGTEKYLSRIASMLENTVPDLFGYSNPALVDELRNAQTLVDQAVANP